MSTGAVISGVEPGGPAERGGLAPGDVILAVDDSPLRDVIDWRWESDGAQVAVEVMAQGVRRAAVLERRPGESWGLAFEGVLFDRVRTCENDCGFCFVSQLPSGLRPSLYLRDDDYRLSFLHGNFVTLTNVTAADIERIAEQRLSPLYVSLHAVTPSVRQALLCAKDDRALSVFDQLLAEEIGLHVQIVLVPGVNDGPELDITLRWLAEREGVLSVGVVPLGYTRHQSRFQRSYESPADARDVLAQLKPWREAFSERDGVSWVHAADELYLNAGVAPPSGATYDGYPQLENGIGLVREFTDAFGEGVGARRRRPARGASRKRTVVVTGTLFAPVARGVLASADAIAGVDVLEVPNVFFGGNVSVAGLLTGADVAAALAVADADARYLLPSCMFNDAGRTLDGLTADDIANEAARDFEVHTADASGLLSAIL